MVVQQKKGTNTRPVDEFTNNTLCAWLLLFSAPQVGLECSTAISTVTRHLQLEYSNESIRHSYSGQWRQCLAQGAILGRNTDKTITRKRIVCVSVCAEKEFPPRCGSLSLPLSLSQFGVIEETQRCKKEIDEEICKKEKTNKTLGIQKAIVCPAEYIHFVSFKCPSDEIK